MGVTAEPASGAGAAYAAVLRQLAASDPPAFLCHWYNVYFAHSAGGRMIGTQVGKMLSLSRPLAFYEYEGEMADHLAAVREKINDVAEKWSREEKDHCLAETAKSFELSGECCVARQFEEGSQSGQVESLTVVVVASNFPLPGLE